MLGWVLTFIVLSVVAAYLGFFALVGIAAVVAKSFLVIFLLILVLVAGARATRGRPSG